MPAPKLSACFFRRLCHKRTKGPNWGVGEGRVLNPVVHIHICTRVHTLQERTQTASLSVLPSTSLRPLRYSIHLLNLLTSPIIFSRANISSWFSFVTACCCFVFLILSFISEIIMLILISNCLAYCCLAYKLFTYQSSSAVLVQVTFLIIFLCQAHIPLKFSMYPLKGQKP